MKLDDLREKIKTALISDTLSWVNVIDAALQKIETEFGVNAYNQAIDDFGLEKMGYKKTEKIK